MHIKLIQLKGFRNFSDAAISFQKQTLIIGANDVGKTNMLFAMRMLLDKSLSDKDIEPTELDFHINAKGGQADTLEIVIHFEDVVQDAILAQWSGKVSADNETFIKYVANRETLQYKLYAGHSLAHLEEIPSRFYLKYLNLRFINSQRDLNRYIQIEKKHLLC